MPDTHQGYGMPIGGVMATVGVVVPNAVGVDIGCGMCAVKTNMNDIPNRDLKTIIGLIRKIIPVGMERHKNPQNSMYMNTSINVENTKICLEEYKNALCSLGTLGGGNHFLEIQKGDDDCIWIMIHSGSRNLGNKVATHYNKRAVELNERYYSSVPKEWQLAFFPIDCPEYHMYMDEMNFCVDYALCNRTLMMERILEIISNFYPPIEFEGQINIAHNYARLENHHGDNVMIHRKGATSAKNGELGIIPGSQGTSSYIVRGKGNQDSFMSCSHGAGRKLGRKNAEKVLNLEDEQKKLNDQGILHSVRGACDLDEAPGAYKDIDTVMKEQGDLVEILVKLQPLAVVKG